MISHEGMGYITHLTIIYFQLRKSNTGKENKKRAWQYNRPRSLPNSHDPPN
jgi:hypothetical protein